MTVCINLYFSLSYLPNEIIDYSAGKSTFLNLLLYHAALLNTDVVIHDASTKSMFLLHKDGTVDDIKPNIPCEVLKLSTLYLFNPAEENTQAFKTSCFTVIATSPDEKHFSNARKVPDMDELYLSPWTFEEVLDANSALPAGQRQDKSTLETRFLLVGGSIRFLLSPTSTYITTEAAVSSQLTNLSFEKLELWYSLIQNEQSVGKLEAPHYLFHCQPNFENGGITCILRFAAKKTEALIVNRITIKTDAEWENFVKLMLQIDSSRSNLGLRFESFIHAYMRNYKDLSNKFRVLKNDNFDLDSVLEKTPDFVRSDNPEEDVANALVDSTCTYVVPSNSDYSAVDSFYVDGTTVYCFRVTINEKHEFDRTAYNNKTKLIRQLYEKAAKAIANKKVHALTFKYCWVVDPDDTNVPLKSYKSHYCIHVKNIYLSNSSFPKSEYVKKKR